MQTPEPTAAAGQPAMSPPLRAALRFGALIWICLLAAHLLAGCGGGGDDPDVGTPRVDCRVEVCR